MEYAVPLLIGLYQAKKIPRKINTEQPVTVRCGFRLDLIYFKMKLIMQLLRMELDLWNLLEGTDVQNIWFQQEGVICYT